MRKYLISLFISVLGLGAEDIYSTFNVAAKQSANLAFDASGTIAKVYIDVASKVKKGDPLVTLQNSEHKAALKMAQAELESALASMKYAKRDYERQSKVKDLIDEARFDMYALTYEKAKAALSKAEANVAYKQSLLDKTTLYAPFDGVIFEKKVEVGDVVNGMMLRTILKIQSATNRKLLLGFDQRHHTKVRVGQKFEYGVDGDTKRYTGVISKIYPFANSGNRKIKAEVEAQDFVVGLFGEGYIKVPDTK